MTGNGWGNGGVFGESEPEDEVPEEYRRFGGLVDGWPERESPARRRRMGVRGYAALVGCVLFLGSGLLGMGVGISQVASGYSAAAQLASAPVCGSAAAQATTAACTMTTVITAPQAVVRGKDEDSLELQTPADEQSDQFLGAVDFVLFPDDARFDAAIGNGASPVAVRVEYWDGQIIAVTAGNRGITVMTDSNPNSVGGQGVGATLASFAFVLISLLISISTRAIRPRWLRLGVFRTPCVFSLTVLTAAAFFAGGCLATQPSWVAGVAEIATPIAVVLMALPWLLVWRVRHTRLRSEPTLG